MDYLKIISAILIWSSLGIFVRESGLTITGVIFYPAVVAGIFQFFLLTAEKLREAKNPRGRNFKRSGSIGAAALLLLIPPCFVANSMLFYYAFTHTTIANAVFTHYTAPVFVALMAPVFLKENVPKTIWLMILISSLGLWLLLGGISPGSSEWKGLLAGTVSGLTYAVLILILREIASGYPALFIIFVQNVIVVLMLLPFAVKTPLRFDSLIYVFILGIVHSTIAPLLYVQGFKSVKANEAAVIGYLEPVGAVILAGFFLHEVPGIKAVLGGVIILCAGLIVVTGKTP